MFHIPRTSLAIRHLAKSTCERSLQSSSVGIGVVLISSITLFLKGSGLILFRKRIVALLGSTGAPASERALRVSLKELIKFSKGSEFCFKFISLVIDIAWLKTPRLPKIPIIMFHIPRTSLAIRHLVKSTCERSFSLAGAEIEIRMNDRNLDLSSSYLSDFEMARL